MPEDTKIASGDGAKPEGELPAGLRIYLEVLEGPDAGKKFELKKANSTIGRKNCEIIINDPAISSRHCSIEVTRENIVLNDNNSTNGTFANGEQVANVPLQNLDEIKIGESRLLFSMSNDPYAIYDDGASAEVSSARVPGLGETTGVLGEGVSNPELPDDFQAVLEILSGPNKGERFRLKNRSTVLGRKGADINLADESVSQRHTQFEVHSKDKITVKDLASRNGTRVNDILISAVKIRNGDIIDLGKTRMTFYFRTGK